MIEFSNIKKLINIINKNKLILRIKTIDIQHIYIYKHSKCTKKKI
jgi:hypothetical protein